MCCNASWHLTDAAVQTASATQAFRLDSAAGVGLALGGVCPSPMWNPMPSQQTSHHCWTTLVATCVGHFCPPWPTRLGRPKPRSILSWLPNERFWHHPAIFVHSQSSCRLATGLLLQNVPQSQHPLSKVPPCCGLAVAQLAGHSKLGGWTHGEDQP